MIEYLYNKTSDNKDNYKVKVGCPNCEDVSVIEVIKAMKVDEWLKDKKTPCKVCGCIDTLQSWRQFLAGRAMLSQLVELASKEEGVDGKKLDHYG